MFGFGEKVTCFRCRGKFKKVKSGVDATWGEVALRCGHCGRHTCVTCSRQFNGRNCDGDGVSSVVCSSCGAKGLSGG